MLDKVSGSRSYLAPRAGGQAAPHWRRDYGTAGQLGAAAHLANKGDTRETSETFIR
jgi:hypothetical protein